MMEIGETHKVRWVKRVKVCNRISFLGLQETQLTNTDAIDVRGCWDSDEFWFSTIQSSGRLGVLLSIWDVNIFEVREIIKSNHFLITIGAWDGIPGLRYL